MNRFRRQLFVGSFLLLVASVLAVMAHCRWSHVLPNYPYLTGWVVLVAMILLAA